MSDTGIPVQAIPVDDLGLRPDAFKLDIEGCEVRCLRGGRQTFGARPPLLVEISEELLVNAGSSADELVAALDDLGYRLMDVNTGRAPQTPIAHIDVLCLADEAG